MSLRQILLPTLSALMLMPGVALAQTIAPTPAPTQAPASAAVPLPAIANLLPIDTAGVVLLNTQAESWEALSRFGLFPKEMTFPELLYPVALGMNFYTDVQPWLGDQVAIAFLPAKPDQKSANRIVTLASVRDAAQIPKYLERLKTAKKKAAIEHQYKGITILEWQPENLSLLANRLPRAENR
ncbi:MAG: DUF3352 domain-containing protein [Leptolyngbyaceae cyanobacterium CSU_1_3]|nr:DUF3352 domain-containing protein [Leptolyngbyaceae cyanobacterium CSU_1_3]